MAIRDRGGLDAIHLTGIAVVESPDWKRCVRRIEPESWRIPRLGVYLILHTENNLYVDVSPLNPTVKS